MKQINPVDAELIRRLQKTSRHFLLHALEHALADERNETNALQTLANIQAALELLTKLRIVRTMGWQGIAAANLHTKTEAQLLQSIQDGQFKSIAFWESRQKASASLLLNALDLKLLDDFQNRRNQLMHLGLDMNPETILDESIWLLVRVITQLDWKGNLQARDHYLSNSLKQFIGLDLYKKLIEKTSYVDEAIDRAYDDFDNFGPVRCCLACGSDAMVESQHGDLRCLVCHFEAGPFTVGFLDCHTCGRRDGVIYDVLNVAGNPSVPGKCGCCRTKTDVSHCTACGRDHLTLAGCSFCSD